MMETEGRYGVVRYATFYAVIDKQDEHHKIVFRSRNQMTAHREAKKRSNAWVEERDK